MRKVLLLLLLALAGCLQLPESSAPKQTVQKGTPPQIDPKLPNQVTTPTAHPVTSPDQAHSSPPALVKKTGPRPALTPDDVNENNTNEVIDRLAQEIEDDLNDRTVPATTVTPTSNAGRPK
jgi:hypothetical protein